MHQEKKWSTALAKAGAHRSYPVTNGYSPDHIHALCQQELFTFKRLFKMRVSSA